MAEEAKTEAPQLLGGPPATLGVPSFYGSSFSVSWTSNDCNVVVSRFVPTGLPAPGGNQVALIQPQVVLHLSAQSAKDLSLVLADGLARYEEEWGEIETDFTRGRK